VCEGLGYFSLSNRYQTFHESACVLSVDTATFDLLAEASDKDTKKGNQMTISPIVIPTPPPAKIVGKALYLELVIDPAIDEDKIPVWRKKGVKQVIIMPEHLDEVGIAQPIQIWERTVSPYSPRSQWDNNIIGNGRLIKQVDREAIDACDSYHFQYPTYTSDEVKAMSAKERHEATTLSLKEKLKSVFLDTTVETDENGDARSKANQLWVVRDSKPLAIEITNEELETARSHTTPQSVIRRIQKARVSAGFPEKLI